ncbi:hypothetical protein K8O92_27490 [Nocardia asteroides]|nr:hypothetical protein K8O92_27490 [Nocardia asteroides]
MARHASRAVGYRRTRADIYAGLCNIDVYTTFTVERGWSPAMVEHWWSEALARELLSS